MDRSNNMIEVKKHDCFLCGNDLVLNSHIIWDKRTKDWKYVKLFDSKQEEIHYINVLCGKCGLAQLETPMTEESLNWFYTTPDIGESPYRKLYPYYEDSSNIHLNNTLDMLSKYLFQVVPLDKCTRYLDIGSADESKLKYIKKLFPNFEQVNCLELGLPKSNNNLHSLEGRVFDCITIINTLEHIYNPKKFLQDLKNNLSEQGVILIAVPDLLNLTINLNLNAWFSGAHLYHFEALTLLNLIISAGYQPCNMVGIQEPMGSKVYMLIKKEDEISKEYIPFNNQDIKYRLEFIKNTSDLLTTRSEVLNGISERFNKK